jgi:transcriptional regulator GlxA family with amidase domain
MQAAPQLKVTVVQLAESMNLSSSRLASLFKSHVGMPPARYLRILRMEPVVCCGTDVPPRQGSND